jgi:MFS family permease
VTGINVLDSPYSWFRLAITFAVATVGTAGMWAVIVVMPALQAEFGIDRAGASLPYVTTMMGFALGNVVIGRSVDRFGVTASLIGAASLLSAGFIAAASAGSVAVLVAAQFLVGLGTGASFAPLIADISHWFSRRRGIAIGVAASGNYMAGAVWPVLIGLILAAADWRTAYLVLAGLVIVLVVPLALLLRRRVPVEARVHADAVATANRRSANLSLGTLQTLLAIAGVACCVAMAMPQVHMVALAVDMGCTPVVGAQILSVMLAAGVVSRIGFGMIADRLGGAPTLIIGSALQCFALALYLPTGGVTGLYVVSLVFGLSQGGIVPAYAFIIREYFPAGEAGARVGFVIMATILGMALGGWLAGFIHDLSGSYTLAFVNGIAWNVLNIAIMLTIIARTRTPRTATA